MRRTVYKIRQAEDKDMENEVMQEQVKRVADKILRLEAYTEIQNNMGSCVLSYNYRRPEEVLSFFSSREDATLEIADEGVFRGKDIREAITYLMPSTCEPGELMDIQLASPIIEVAEDLETARAQWVCPGIGALPREEEAPQAIWNWGVIGADFIYEDSSWKIWHFHWFRLMKCDYQKGWVQDTSLENRPNIPVHPLAEESTYHNPYTPYSIRECIPMYPRPYKTWDGEDWMLKKKKE